MGEDRAGGQVLIGVDDVETPYWAKVDRTVIDASGSTMVRAVPRVLAATVRQAFRAAPALTVTAGVLQLLSGAVTAFGLLATAEVFTGLLTSGPTPDRVLAALPSIALVAASYAARGLLDAATGLVHAVLEPRVEMRAQDALYTALIGVDVVAFDDADFAELTNQASGMGLSHLRSTTTTVGDLLSSLVSVVAAMVTAGILHPLLAPVVLLSVLPQGWATIRAAKIAYASFLSMTSRHRRQHVTTQLIVSRADAAEIRAFTAQDVLLAEHRRIAAELAAEAVRVQTRTTSVRLAGRTVSGIGTAVAYTVLGLLLYTGSLQLALAGAAALALRTASGAVSTSVHSANRLYEAGFYLDLYHRALTDAAARTRAPEVPAPRTSPEPSGGPARTAPRPVPPPRLVELDDVTFTYPGQDRPAVHGVSLALRAGQSVALVGENGSGKSTLAKLLTGLYLPQRGAVRWDGTDIAELDPRALHEHIAVVLQNPTEWPMTAANNVRIGRITAADPDGLRLDDATQRSGADAVFAELTHGPDTVLSRQFQTGRDLSGGQWQRISVARGLYRDAPLVIADEPTAAMDARAEHAVFAHLRELGDDPDRITVLVTHRLANIRHADRIAVLEHGRLTEHGPHEHLIAADGTYADLFGLQAAHYTDP